MNPAEEGKVPENIPVRMLREHLRDIPAAPFPAGFSLRTLRRDEGPLWTAVQRDAERLMKIEDDLFDRQFGYDPDSVEERCFLIVAADGYPVGTVSGWHAPEGWGPEWGRIHWVAVRPGFQGRGLARAGVAHALRAMAARGHTRALLDTSTLRPVALRLYLDYGFRPDMTYPRAEEAWIQVRSAFTHPGLAGR